MVQNRQTLLERARIGAGANLFLRSKSGYDMLNKSGLINNSEIIVIPACAHEPAVVSFHRLERQHVSHIFLATEIDGVGEAVLLSTTEKESSTENIELTGGMTTGDWMISMRTATNDTTFSASGTEFKTVLDSLGTFATAAA